MPTWWSRITAAKTSACCSATARAGSPGRSPTPSPETSLGTWWWRIPNQDGKQDVAVADETNIATNGFADIFWGNGDEPSPPADVQFRGEAPHSIAVGDFDWDGLPDLVTGNQQSNTVGVLLNAPAFAAATNLISPNDDVFTVQIGHLLCQWSRRRQRLQRREPAPGGGGRLCACRAEPEPHEWRRTVNTAAETLAGLTVSRRSPCLASATRISPAPSISFSNPTGAPISTTVTVLGNLGSDAATYGLCHLRRRHEGRKPSSISGSAPTTAWTAAAPPPSSITSTDPAGSNPARWPSSATTLNGPTTSPCPPDRPSNWRR